jgi:putative endopeptidase
LLRYIAIAALVLGGCRTASGPAQATSPAAQPVPGIDPSLFDATAKPCEDFYAYACGGWIAKTALPPDKPRWMRSFTGIEERNLTLLREIAERQAAGGIDPADRYAGKVGDFWAACMDEPGIEQRGTSELRASWARIDEVKDVPSLARLVAHMHKEGFFPVFEIRSEQDAKDSRQVIGVIGQGGLSLPDRDYYLKTDARTVAIQKLYREHLARMFQLAGEPAKRAAGDAKAIYGLERSMAEAQWSLVELRDPRRTHNRVDRVGLERAAPRFPWKAYLEALGHPGLDAFSATTPQYLARLNELLERTRAGTWRAYLKWRLLSEMASDRALPKAFTEERFAYQSKSFTGTKELEPRWKHCVKATSEALGEAIGQAYVRRHFGPDGKQKTSQLVSDIEGAMARAIDGLSWMDEATRARAREKLQRIGNKIGYPDSWRNYDSLQPDRRSFYKSLLAANAFEVNRDLDKIGKPLDRGEWGMIPPQVNAYYEPPMNEMVFPAGILQPPFYTRGAPDAVNYGAIGMVVGHELTHGFDDEGRQFDAAGNLRDWWTGTVAKEFDRRAECVADQYGGYTAIDDLKLNGKLTLGENIADLGGLKLAFSAYQASRAGKPAEEPVAGFTPEQAFYISYAQSWCTAIRPEFARLLAQTDEHSAPRWRVNGPLSNLPEFQKAFACPAGSPMVRSGEKRCEVW